MRKLNAVFNSSSNDSLSSLAKKAEEHQALQRLWLAASPKLVGESSFAAQLKQGQLTIYASNPSVAAKIKLTSANLLKHIQELAASDPYYKGIKVTAIVAKVQVKSQEKRPLKGQRIISKQAKLHLNNLAEQLGESLLAGKLRRIADKQQ